MVADRRADEERPSVDRILETAEQLFETEGYEPVSLRQLMAAAEVSTTAFYKRFPSKGAVVGELAVQMFGQIQAAATETLAKAKTLESGIELGVDLLCEQLGPRRALVRVILSEAGGAFDAVASRRFAYGQLTDVLAERLGALAKAKRISVADPTTLAWALVGALEMQVTRWAVWDEITVEELRKQLRATAKALLPKESK